MEEENQNSKSNRTNCSSSMSDVVLGCVMPYIHDPRDRDAVSLVCRRWYELDALTRKHITIAFCYTTSPDRLRRRFKHLESLKLKGKPRAAMFNLIPEDWGGFVTPWVNEIAESFNCLKSLHFRRMIVTDSDLEVLAKSRGRVLQTRNVIGDRGLEVLASSCRRLKRLRIELGADEQGMEDEEGCPSLQKLEMRGCCFTESALARAVMQLTSLRYLWVQGYRASSSNPGRDLSAMVRPFWNIELIPPRKVVVVNQVGEDVVVEQPAHILAYYSLAGPRTDFPNSVVPLDLVG
ncbi:hypothetical protein GH714_036810 [Hevea brasiliensis]|uniref:Coronatine-insensitive 1 n=1 Tax=Hevea brasiliensis TaxID=3981 RepID=A0A6A6L7G4_HEVBR|nr:hypothetical protein GH714_036810 [Hevea brasiliensis]